MDKELIKKFLNCYGPDEKLDQVYDDVIDRYHNILPDEFLALWYNFGFGNYGGGILKVINPDEFKKNLYLWIRKEDPNCIPFMITAFGDIFYYRKESNTYYLLSIHYRKEKKCADSLEEFISYITSAQAIHTDLRAGLYIEAEKKLGSLSNDDIYMFVPSIQFGGKEIVDNIQKAEAVLWQNIAYGD